MPVLEKDRKLLWKEIKGLKEIVKVLPGLKEMIQTLQELVAELYDRAEIFGEMANWRIRAINSKASASKRLAVYKIQLKQSSYLEC